MEDESQPLMTTGSETDFPGEMVQFLTTEHFTLQSARSQVVSESNGRLSGYLTLLSATIVALAFIAQISDSLKTLLTFVFILVPTVMFLGIVTIGRIIQLGVSEIIYVRGMNRIRHYFTEVAPEAERYLVLSIHDDPIGIERTMLMLPGLWQNFLGLNTLIIGLNSTLLAVIIGFLSLDLLMLTNIQAIGVAIMAFVLLFFLHAFPAKRFAMSIYRQTIMRDESRFPSLPE